MVCGHPFLTVSLCLPSADAKEHRAACIWVSFSRIFLPSVSSEVARKRAKADFVLLELLKGAC